MTGRISIPALRRDYEAWDKPHIEERLDTLLALVEAVEAAQALASWPFGDLPPRKFYALREALARFDFGEET